MAALTGLDPTLTTAIVPVSAALLAAFAITCFRRLRHTPIATAGRAVAAPIVLAWEAQGVYELAKQIGVDGPPAIIFASVTSTVLITLASFADEHHAQHGNLGIPGRLVWVVAAPMGVIVAMSADSAAEAGLRIILPLMAALVWWVPYAPARPSSVDGEPQHHGTWRWSARRIGVTLGLIDPTDADISEIHLERHTRVLTSHALRAHYGPCRRWSARRLQKHAQFTNTETVAEVAARVTRARMVVELTDPDTTPGRLTELLQHLASRRDALLSSPRRNHLPDPAPAPPTPTSYASAPMGALGAVTRVADHQRSGHHEGATTAAEEHPAELSTGRVELAPGVADSSDASTVPAWENDVPAASDRRLPHPDRGQPSPNGNSPDGSQHGPGIHRPARSRPSIGRDFAAEAESTWRDSVAAGAPLTGAALGHIYGYSPSWGRTIIAAAKRRDRETGPTYGAPAPREPSAGGALT